VIRVYREVGYPYLLMPDHVPIAPNDPNSLQSFYIRALLQALEAKSLRGAPKAIE